MSAVYGTNPLAVFEHCICCGVKRRLGCRCVPAWCLTCSHCVACCDCQPSERRIKSRGEE